MLRTGDAVRLFITGQSSGVLVDQNAVASAISDQWSSDLATRSIKVDIPGLAHSLWSTGQLWTFEYTIDATVTPLYDMGSTADVEVVVNTALYAVMGAPPQSITSALVNNPTPATQAADASWLGGLVTPVANLLPSGASLTGILVAVAIILVVVLVLVKDLA